MKTLRNITIVIVLVAAFSVVLSRVVRRIVKANGAYAIDSNWATTAGTLIQPKISIRGTTLFKYYFHGSFYQGVSSRYNITKTQYTVPGEKYLIRVNPKYPSEYIPIESRPIFTDDEVTDTVPGRIISTTERTDLDEKRLGLLFEYHAHGNQYERFQEVPQEDSSSFNRLSSGQSFTVRYWDKDPQRAIIYLDSVWSWPLTQ